MSTLDPTLWAVYDADNFECGGIASLHWSYEGAYAAALKLVAAENALLTAWQKHNDEIERYPKAMEQQGSDKWYWTHRTIEVKEASVER